MCGSPLVNDFKQGLFGTCRLMYGRLKCQVAKSQDPLSGVPHGCSWLVVKHYGFVPGCSANADFLWLRAGLWLLADPEFMSHAQY